jgi:hypothetical protein
MVGTEKEEKMRSLVGGIIEEEHTHTHTDIDRNFLI